jgi:hypothetical protein
MIQKAATVPDGVVQKPVPELAVPAEISVLPQVAAPGDRHLAGFVVLPGLTVQGGEMFIRLGGEPRRAALDGGLILAAYPVKALVHAGLRLPGESVIGEAIKSKPPVVRPVPSTPPVAAPVILQLADGRALQVTCPQTCSAGAQSSVPVTWAREASSDTSFRWSASFWAPASLSGVR